MYLSWEGPAPRRRNGDGAVRRLLAVVALSAIAAAVVAPAPAAASASTMYDMSIFLNQPYPLDTAPLAAPVLAPVTAPAPTAVPIGDEIEDEIEIEFEDEDDNDPLEPLNRFIFGFNEALRIVFARPASRLYNGYVPQVVRDSIGNFIDNLNTPITLANDILQGEPMRAWQTTERMVINSTIGLAGLFDVAESWLEIPAHEEDFGQTMGVWGVGEGFYFVIPLLGPSNPRDTLGIHFADGYLDPVGMWLSNTNQDELAHLRTGLSTLDQFAGVNDQLDDIKKTTIDFYAAIRSMYRQKRKSEINNGEDVVPLPVLGLDTDLSFDQDAPPDN